MLKQLMAAGMLFALAEVAIADLSFSCGQSVVSVGDDKLTVFEKCGEPKFKELVSGANERRVEAWYYKRGTQQFTRILTFDGTKLVRIETLSR